MKGENIFFQVDMFFTFSKKRVTKILAFTVFWIFVEFWLKFKRQQTWWFLEFILVLILFYLKYIQNVYLSKTALLFFAVHQLEVCKVLHGFHKLSSGFLQLLLSVEHLYNRLHPLFQSWKPKKDIVRTLSALCRRTTSPSWDKYPSWDVVRT